MIQTLCFISLIYFLLIYKSIISTSNVVSEASNPSMSSPYWVKPGCHKVGHTREISIAGCVKFNLSTNACRGFCMSYSIPATEEPAVGTIDELVDNKSGKKSGELIGQVSLQQQQQRHHQQQRQIFGNYLREQMAISPQQQQMMINFMNGIGNVPKEVQLVSELHAMSTDSTRRDVISVSQCCNMMETEDIIINLRCGKDEVRRLVFKSAKSCECFFCKHI